MLIVSHDHVLNVVSSTEPWWTIVNCVQLRSIVANNGQPWSTMGNYVTNHFINVMNHFHEHWNLTNLSSVSIQQPSWMWECDKSLPCHNMMSTLMNVAIWQRHCCLSHYNIYFHECHNVTSTLMSVAMYVIMWHYNATSTLMNAKMWHSSKSILMNLAMWHQFLWMLQYDIKFDECCNATSTLMNVAL